MLEQNNNQGGNDSAQESENAIKNALKDIENGAYLSLIERADELPDGVAPIALTLEERSLANLSGTVDVSTNCGQAMFTIAEMVREVNEVNNHSQAISAAAEEMVASVSEIASTSESASEEAHQMSVIAKEGMDSADRAEETMQNIATAVEGAATQVDSLAEASTEIGAIVNTIEAIAKQTNLLALNATIEAARAGEAGKGFAVVAGEVKGLATQTAQATEDIRNRIDKLRHEMTVIVSSMEQGAKAVQDGRDVIHKTGQGMHAIGDQINVVTGKMEDISGILAQQSAASQEVAEGITTIAKMADENVVSISEIVDTLEISDKIIVERLEDLVKLDIGAKVVEIAKADHVRFMKNLMYAMIGRVSIQPNELPDHHGCRLGKWYDDFANDPISSNIPAFSELKAPHLEVHAKGRSALVKLHDGDLEGALNEVKLAGDASKEVLRILDDVKIGYRQALGLN
ncbi:MAG: methyl-accepting chemotaxis protein [Rhodospirillales bacterium]|nr:methyl-accepting chemotaxis protein [Rhodospirillales bacterium]